MISTTRTLSVFTIELAWSPQKIPCWFSIKKKLYEWDMLGYLRGYPEKRQGFNSFDFQGCAFRTSIFLYQLIGLFTYNKYIYKYYDMEFDEFFINALVLGFLVHEYKGNIDRESFLNDMYM